MSKIVLQDIQKYYGKNHVLKDIHLTIEDGEFMTLLGPSGCGKTTTLRVISGLERPQEGFIFMDEKLVVNAREQFFAPPAQRGLNLVFQSYALWPHMTVFDNVAFGLQVKKMAKETIRLKVESALQRMQIAEFATRYPSELSGGQQQRVAIARAIAGEPKILLLDEPLSNLDAKLRVDMRSELKRLHRELGTTVVYVTHDQVEALTLSTRIAVFFDGAIEQVATPMEVYANPANLKVAGFIGNPRINLLKGRAETKGDFLEVESALGHFRFDRQELGGELTSPACRIGFRPEQVTLHPTEVENSFEASVYSCMPAGSETLVSVRKGEDSFLIKELGTRDYEINSPVYLSVNPHLLNVFDEETGKLIKRSVDL